MKTAELALAFAGIGLQACLCVLLQRRGASKVFPWFYLYTIFSVVSSVTSLALRNLYSIYFYEYWIAEAFYVVLAFLALQEAFRSVFRNFYSLPWFRLLFPGIGILMVVVALLRLALSPRTEGEPIFITIISLEVAVGLLQLGIFALFVVLVRFFHMRWSYLAFGVVMGFGIASAGTLITFLLRSEFGKKFDPIVRITPPIAYIIAVLVWLATFLRAAPLQPKKDGDSALTPEQMITELRRYTKAVKGILER